MQPATECPSATRLATALLSAATVRRDFIRKSMQ